MYERENVILIETEKKKKQIRSYWKQHKLIWSLHIVYLFII